MVEPSRLRLILISLNPRAIFDTSSFIDPSFLPSKIPIHLSILESVWVSIASSIIKVQYESSKTRSLGAPHLTGSSSSILLFERIIPRVQLIVVMNLPTSCYKLFWSNYSDYFNLSSFQFILSLFTDLIRFILRWCCNRKRSIRWHIFIVSLFFVCVVLKNCMSDSLF